MIYGINPDSLKEHEQIQAIADRDSIDYSEAYIKFHQGDRREDLSCYTPESLKLHRIVEATAQEYGFDYAEAYTKVVNVLQSGKVPLLKDWSKI